MQEEKFGKIIKEIRKKYHLTQKDLAEKYHVTYQAVSKWENNKNLPDVTLMKKISEDFSIPLKDLMEGNFNQKKKFFIPLIIGVLLLLIIIIFLLINNHNDFETKQVSSMCNDYKVSGIISYNASKSVIYIPKIEYCGEDIILKEIDCTLYEKNNDITKKISNYSYQEEITLKDFMQKVTFNVDNYLKVCKEWQQNSFYLEIKAKDRNNKDYFHQVPLTLSDNCS